MPILWIIKPSRGGGSHLTNITPWPSGNSAPSRIPCLSSVPCIDSKLATDAFLGMEIDLLPCQSKGLEHDRLVEGTC